MLIAFFQRIPLIFPVQSGAPEKSTIENKPVALITDGLRLVDGHATLKQDPTPVKVDDPVSQRNTTRNKSGGDGERTQYKVRSQLSKQLGFYQRSDFQEHRRVCHINAEQKRRCNIKNGFDMLQSLLPTSGLSGSSSSSSGQSSGKTNDVSKATMLHRGAEYIRVLRQERQQQQEEMEHLKQNIEALNTAIR